MKLSAGCLRIPQLSVIATALFFAGCGSTPAPKQTRTTVKNTVDKPAVEVEVTPAQLLSRAQDVWLNERDADKRNALLLEAARLYLEDDQTPKAQQVLLSLKQSSLSAEHRILTNLYIARAYMTQPSISESELLELLTPLSGDEIIRRQQQTLRAGLFEQQHQWLAAADALIDSRDADEELVAQVWQWINEASDKARADAETRFPSLRPYLALYDLAAQEGLNAAALSRSLEQFSRVYRGHPLVQNMPAEIIEATQVNAGEPQEVVVLLPLSGKLAATGTTVKEGLLSAYYQQSSDNQARRAPVKLHFVDTVDQSADDLLAAVAGYRWVIGPLLKENVDAIINRVSPDTYMLALNRADFPTDGVTLSTSGSGIESSNVPVLADITRQAEQSLNTLAQANAKHAFFALAPEDEARQLADYIYQNGFKTPIVVSAQNSVNQRMKSAFTARWKTLNENVARNKKVKLTSVDFTDSNSLREGITQSLDVAQSRDRIKQIEYMVNEKLYNVPRNRRDVDAIIVFASPEQTELLNPMVEASLSPFNGQTVPVFATSRSIEYDDSKNQWRDLQNVRFLDMPWMMPQNQWQALKSQSQDLWPQRSTNMSRLFAFGVDAYNLLPHVPGMMTLPQIRINGLSGTMRINEQGEVIRTLPQAIIDNQAVKLISDNGMAAAGR